MNIFSFNFWVSAFVNTLITMLCIYAIKKITGKYNVPVLSTVANEV